MQDVAFGWFVIPGVLGGLLGSLGSLLWNHRAAKELRALESRLRIQEEAYRVAHSPRMAAALDMGDASCRFERALEMSLAPSVSTYDVATPGDMDEIPGTGALLRAAAGEMREAWRDLAAARDRAEVLVPAQVFEAFEQAFRAYNAVHDARWAERMGIAGGEERLPPGGLDEARRLRARALEALQRMAAAGNAPG
jgi:hypothetical protein